MSGQVQIHQACRRSTVTLLAPNTAASACACLTHVSSDPIRSSLSDPWDPHASKLVTTDTVHAHVMLKHMLTEARHPQLQRFRCPALITPAQGCHICQQDGRHGCPCHVVNEGRFRPFTAKDSYVRMVPVHCLLTQCLRLTRSLLKADTFNHSPGLVHLESSNQHGLSESNQPQALDLAPIIPLSVRTRYHKFDD